MRALDVSIELGGDIVRVGGIVGNDFTDAVFTYDEAYLSMPEARAISISLPLKEESYTPSQTRNYFEGLLPEGFMKLTVAQRMRTDESDYLTILAGLGRECLGALMITDGKEDNVAPSYDRMSIEQLKELAREGATKSVQLVTKAHLSLAGASGKVGLYFNPEEMAWYVPMGNAPSTHIIKQSHIRLDSIVLNEQLSLTTAKELGIDVPDTHIINTGNAGEDEVLFATARYDRVFSPKCKMLSGLRMPMRMHQEDMAQTMGIASVSKYETDGGNHMKGMFDIIRKHSANPIEDQLKLWDIIVFDYLIGNTDNHIKNTSVLYSENLRNIRLAPAYDIISTVVYENSSRDMAFNIGGEYDIDKLTREHFSKAAKECGLGEKIAMIHFDKMENGFEKALEKASERLTIQGFNDVWQLRDKILIARNKF